MQYPQLLIHERDGRLAAQFRELAAARAALASKERQWALHEPRQIDSCLKLLRRGGPSVLVVKLGADPERELTLIERVAWLFPETAVFVVTDAGQDALAALAWDLGARYVCATATARSALPEMVETWVRSARKAAPPRRPLGAEAT